MLQEFTYVKPEDVSDYWQLVGPILKKATDVSEGRYSISDLKERCESGAFQLWLVIDNGRVNAALTFSISIFPQKRILSIHYLGGEMMKDWIAPLADFMQRMTLVQQCDGLEFVGRPGWEKVLAPFGLRKAFVHYIRGADEIRTAVGNRGNA